MIGTTHRMLEQLRPAAEISGTELQSLPDSILEAGQPVVLRGAFRAWPFIGAAVRSDEAAAGYLNQFYNGRAVSTIIAAPSEHGRFFYEEDSKRLNFEPSSESLTNVLGALLEQRNSERPPGIAVQALMAAESLPGFEAANANRFLPAGSPARLWIGNRVTVAPHFDVADNLACVAAGRRRFILFPPEQTPNIYPGPMDVTPANVPISMVSLDEPELGRFPRYRKALDAGLVAELGPGDAIYIPYLWWHGVQSLTGFNILVNYWWNRDPASGRYPYAAFLRAAYALFREMPAEHRNAWRSLYDHYVFQVDGDPMSALSPVHKEDERVVDPERIVRLRAALRELLG